MQIVQYVHRSGEGLPDHAQVTEISQATAEAVRPQAHAALDSLVNDIKAGWTPPTMTAADQKAAADAAVTAAEQAEAQKAVDAEAADEKEDAAEAPKTNGSKSGPLPDDFPGVTALRDAGIKTYAQLRAAGDVTQIPGIGDATAAKIKAALA